MCTYLSDISSCILSSSVGFQVGLAINLHKFFLNQGWFMNKKTPKELLSTLSTRQLEVLRLFCQGKKYRNIGKKLYIAEGTVKTHMTSIWERLELLDLDPNERKFNLRSIYCPLLKERFTENKEYDRSNDTEPASKLLEENEVPMTDQSTMNSLNNNQVGKNLKSDKRKGTNTTLGCVKIFGFLLLLGFAAVGIFFIWQQIRQGVSDVISLIPTSDVAPAVPTVSFVTDIPSADDEQTDDKPSSSSAPDGIKEIGEWHKEDDLWMRVQNFEISSNSNYIEIEFEIWNKSSDVIYFSWLASDSLSMTDNMGTKYELTYPDRGRAIEFAVDDRIDLDSAVFYAEPLFKPAVTELYFTVENISRVSQAIFRIPIGK
jgi:hypothetical protein